MRQILFFSLLIITFESEAQAQFSSFDNEYKVGTIFISAITVSVTTFNVINFDNERKQKHETILGLYLD